jgi:hypothetical protein
MTNMETNSWEKDWKRICTEFKAVDGCIPDKDTLYYMKGVDFIREVHLIAYRRGEQHATEIMADSIFEAELRGFDEAVKVVESYLTIDEYIPLGERLDKKRAEIEEKKA